MLQGCENSHFPYYYELTLPHTQGPFSVPYVYAIAYKLHQVFGYEFFAFNTMVIL